MPIRRACSSNQQHGVDAAVHLAVVLELRVSACGLLAWGEEWSGTVICAYLPQTTFPPAVTIPSSLMRALDTIREFMRVEERAT